VVIADVSAIANEDETGTIYGPVAYCCAGEVCLRPDPGCPEAYAAVYIAVGQPEPGTNVGTIQHERRSRGHHPDRDPLPPQSINQR
jgi:hypothetical protein